MTSMRIPKAAIYARYSTDRQDARSIDDQIRRCRAFAASRGYEVVAEFSDAAQSGAHDQRVGMQKMLAETRERRPPKFSVVIVDDLSRLSRDLGNTWRIVFEDLASCAVAVIDATTGMASDGAGARLTFGAMALVNDTFLELVRTETHRGLEGRALSGHWTGGRCYGFKTLKEEKPPDPEHPRSVLVIDPIESQVVLRVFTLFSEGVGLKGIASRLNAELIPAPYDDGGYDKPAGKGWGPSTIRAMLENERYVGHFVWNKRKWLRQPGKKSKRCVLRPREEWIERDWPHLAIVSKDVWELVQLRFKQRKSVGRGRAHGEGTHPHLLSGSLRCGTCGSTMSIVGSKKKAGKTYFQYGCAAHRGKGTAICSNSMVVSESKVNASVIGALRDILCQPQTVRRFVERFVDRLNEPRKPKVEPEAAALEEQVTELEGRIRNLTQAIAQAGWSSALGEHLRREEEALAGLRARRTKSEAKATRARVTVEPSVVQGYLHNLVDVLEQNPEQGRGILKKHVGQIVMTPKSEGPNRFYEATGAFNISVAITGSRGVSDGSSCGGAHWSPTTTSIPYFVRLPSSRKVA